MVLSSEVLIQTVYTVCNLHTIILLYIYSINIHDEPFTTAAHIKQESAHFRT